MRQSNILSHIYAPCSLLAKKKMASWRRAPIKQQLSTFGQKNGKLEEGSYQVATFHLWNQRFLTQKCVNTAFLSQKWVNTAFLSRKWVNTAFLSRKWVNTAFLLRKFVNTAFFVAKFCKYALIDSFQGYPAVVDSSASCAALVSRYFLFFFMSAFDII